MLQSLIITSQDQVTTLTLNRPEKCNALDGDLVEALRRGIFAAQRDPLCRVVILKGAGLHFCAGADIAWMRKLAQSSFDLGRDDARNLACLLLEMTTLSKPIIAVAQGTSLGGGVGLLACADVVVVSEGARFGFSEAKLGLIPAVVSPYILSRIGMAATRRYFLTAETFDTGQALSLGLVDYVVAEDELAVKALALAHLFKANSPLALAEVKRLLPTLAHQSFSLELAEKTAEMLAHLRTSEEVKEGFSAFLEKRQPSWSRQ